MSGHEAGITYKQTEWPVVFPPKILNRSRRGIRYPIRVVVFNARGGVRLEEIASCFTQPPLSGAALILLCEADWRTRRARGEAVAAELARRLNMSFAYLPQYGFLPEKGEIRSFLGNAILSAEPLDRVTAIPMPDPDCSIGTFRRRRSPSGRVGGPAGLVAAVDFGGERLTVSVVHMNRLCGPLDRERQMAAFLPEFPRSGPAVLGGDLNTTTTELGRPGAMLGVICRAAVNPRRFKFPERFEPLFERLREIGLEVGGANVAGRPTFTFTRFIPPLMRPKLDWIAIRDLRPLEGSARVIPARSSLFARRVSDHDFVVLDVER